VDRSALSLVPTKRSHSAAAQSGMQASLGNVIQGQGDHKDLHFEDTVRGSDWGVDQPVLRLFVQTAPQAVRAPAAWSLPWSRVRRGAHEVILNGQKLTLTECDGAHGLVAHLPGVRRHRPRDAAHAERPGHCRVQSCA
jgi:fumarate reductase flavoprotein subunit